MEQVVAPENAQAALKAVIRNRGAAGIDGMTTRQLKTHWSKHGETIRAKLLAGTYRPNPVRGIEIPKPGGGKRKLGIPTVMDRMVQQMLLQVLQPIFDPTFSANSHGFRPGRNAHDAVRYARACVEAGEDWVVDIDITQFFDCVNHDILINRIGKTIRDKRVLRLIGQCLRAGVMMDGVAITSEEGTPQGGPTSPLLANIYLDALDRELEKRGLAFCRYADDANIYVGSEHAARRVFSSVSAWIGKHLRLEVNAKKSGIGRPWERKFLGFCINPRNQIEVSPQSVERFKDRVRELWRGNQSRSSKELRDKWNVYVKGWWEYYRLNENTPSKLSDAEVLARRHIRKCFWLRWHNVKGRIRALRRLGISRDKRAIVCSSKGAWRIAASPPLQIALSNEVLRRYGFQMPSELAAPR